MDWGNPFDFLKHRLISCVLRKPYPLSFAVSPAVVLRPTAFWPLSLIRALGPPKLAIFTNRMPTIAFNFAKSTRFACHGANEKMGEEKEDYPGEWENAGIPRILLKFPKMKAGDFHGRH